MAFDPSRRGVIAGSFAAGAALPAGLRLDPGARADDEAYWGRLGRLWDRPAGVIQLENGNFGAMARPVLHAYEQGLTRVNRDTSFYARRGYGADLARVRARAAASLGVGADEIVFTRGATEALMALISGYTGLKPGDQALYADLDYDSTQAAMGWLKTRRGVDAVTIALPEPTTHQGLIDAYDQALAAHPKVRLMLLTHVSHRTGLVLPVAEIVEAARRRGVDVILDSAHAWGQLDFKLPELKADFVGLTCQKWIGAPLGVGVMYVRRERLADLDPAIGAEAEAAHEIDRKVHSGTVNLAAFLAVEAALDLCEQIGVGAKQRRLKRLRDLWAEPLRDHPGVEILTPADPRLTSAITSFRLTGRVSAAENQALAKTLLARFGVFTVHRTGVAKGACIRVTPALINVEADVARLVEALKTLAN